MIRLVNIFSHFLKAAVDLSLSQWSAAEVRPCRTYLELIPDKLLISDTRPRRAAMPIGHGQCLTDRTALKPTVEVAWITFKCSA